MVLRKLAPIILAFALGSGIITGSIVYNQKNTQIKHEQEVVKDRNYEILKHETNYDDLHKRYDHVKANYDNLGDQWEMLKDQRDNLRNENQRLKNQLISRGKKRSLSTRRRAYGRASAGISRRRSLVEIAWAESKNDYNAKNPHSSASGKYQFLDKTWQSTTGLPGSARDYPASTQDWAAQKLYAAAGDQPWKESAR